MRSTAQYVPRIAPARPALAGRRLDRSIIVFVVLGAAIAGFAVTEAQTASHAVSLAGADLVRLLRAMAAIKATMTLAAIAAVLWRLAAPVGPARLTAYAASCAAMAAGPGLIWDMAHVGMGALLLHGGLAAVILLLWQDPASETLLSAALARRRQRI